jgi:hypothetical protein
VRERFLYELALVQAHRGALAAAEETLALALEAGFPITTVSADNDAEPLRATEVFRRWSATRSPSCGSSGCRRTCTTSAPTC